MSKRKLLLAGWDAADWKLIGPLMDRGEMPNLERFVNKGVMGSLAAFQPILSPLLWNSIATGVLPDRHGILGSTQIDPVTGKARPFSPQDRKVKAVWNILSRKGHRTNVVNWSASHPAEPINGVCISDLYVQSAAEQILATELPLVPKSSVHPADLSDTLSEFRVLPTEIDPDQIRLFVPRFAEVDQKKDPHLTTLAKLLAECFTIHAAATWVMENNPWDFMAVCYTGIDRFCHAFMKFHPPRQSHISRREFELYSDVVNSAYRLHDLLLGRLLQLAGEDATVMVCSDHGYHSNQLRQRYSHQTAISAAAEHRPVGILAMKGPGIKEDEMIHGASVLDLAPTVLRLFDLPIGRDMAGRPLLDAFVEPLPVETVPSWEDVEGPAGMPGPRVRLDAAEQMPKSDGIGADYAGLAAVENRWNLARVLVGSGRPFTALPLLEELHEECPLRLEFALCLAECRLSLGLKEEATELVEGLIALSPNHPLARLYRGMLEYERGNAGEALAQFTSLEASNPILPPFFNYRGLAYLRMNRVAEARNAFARALDLDPQNATAHLGEARCQLRLGNDEAAVQNALLALGVNFSMAPAHYHLGLALTRLGDFERAVQAFETCLRFNPHYYVAQRCLIRVCASVPEMREKAEHHRRLYQETSKARLGRETQVERFRREARLRAIERQNRRATKDKALMEAVDSQPSAEGRFSSDEPAQHPASKDPAIDLRSDVRRPGPPQTLPSHRVRSALPKDVAGLAPHFGLALQHPSHARLFVIEDSFGTPCGGGYLLFSPAAPEGVLFDLHIFKEERLASAGAELLVFFRDFCRACGIQHLILARPVREKSLLDELLQAHGFNADRALTIYEVAVAALWKDFETSYQRLVQRGKLPVALALVPLREAPFIPVRELVQRTIGGNPLNLERQLGDRLFCETTSIVARLGPVIVGVVLARTNHDRPEITYLAVEHGRKNGPLYVILSREYLRKLRERGNRVLILKTYNQSVMHSVERAGGTVAGREFNYRLALR